MIFYTDLKYTFAQSLKEERVVLLPFAIGQLL